MRTLPMVLLAGVAAAAPDVHAQTLLHEFTGSSGRDAFGISLAAADVDRDGVDDLIVGAPWDDAAGSNAGRVVVYSGADGSIVHEWFGEHPGDVFGARVAAPGDLDGDGYGEVLVGAPGFEAVFDDEGRAYVLSGRSGDVVRVHDGLPFHEAWGGRLGAVGDVSGDGVPDYGIGDTWIWDRLGLDPLPLNGDTFLYSGADGAPLALAPINGGAGLMPAGDTNGDGVGDFVLSAWQFDFSGPQALLHGGPVASVLDSVTLTDGYATAGPVADLDGDTRPDYAFAYGGWSGPQTLEVRSALAGTLLTRTFDADDVALHGLASQLDGRADLNGDGTPDLLVGRPTSDVGGLASGEVVILSGADLSTLLTIEGGSERGEFGRQVVVLGDLDGDGHADYAVSQPASNQFNPGVPGVVRVYSGGALGWTDLGQPLPGSQGPPQLVGTGFLLPGMPFALELGSAAPGSSVVLVFGLSGLSAPLFGGVLGPAPDVLVFGLSSDASGALTLAGTWPDGIPPATTLWFQLWIDDAAGPQGWAASNTVTATNAP